MASRKRFHTVQALANELAQDPELAEEIKADPQGAIAQRARALSTDVWIYRVVVGGLSLAVLMCLIGAIIIALSTGGDGEPIAQPEILLAIGSAAVGSLAGLLVPNPSSD